MTIGCRAARGGHGLVSLSRGRSEQNVFLGRLGVKSSEGRVEMSFFVAEVLLHCGFDPVELGVELITLGVVRSTEAGKGFLEVGEQTG